MLRFCCAVCLGATVFRFSIIEMKHNKAQNVYLRQRPRKNGTIALFLDISGNGKRKNEYLKLYLVPERSREDKLKNKETLRMAEAIRAQRLIEVQAKQFGVEDTVNDDAKFFDVLQQIIDDKGGATKRTWRAFQKHLQHYEHNKDITFRDIKPQWVRGFRDYLDSDVKRWATDGRRSNDSDTKLAQGSKALMFNLLCTVFNTAVRNGIILKSPANGIKRFRKPESQREFLTVEELRRLQETPPPSEVMARAFFFSCLTGLRWSDVVKLSWGDVQEMPTGVRIVFRQKKTGGMEYLDINEQAASMLGKRRPDESLVFEDIGSKQTVQIKIATWVRCAGINKHITFHCARHTFAVMMLDLGVDLYTVSKLLGHRDISTTQIYAKVLDKNKQAAVAKIPPIFKKK